MYAFYRLCKLHGVSNGNPDDFRRLRATLRENREFRSGVFRLAASVLGSEPELSVADLLVIVALAVGGPGVAGDDQLEVPDELLETFRSVLTPDEVVESHAGAGAEPAVMEPVRMEPTAVMEPAAEQRAPVGIPAGVPVLEVPAVAAQPAELQAAQVAPAEEARVVDPEAVRGRLDRLQEEGRGFERVQEPVEEKRPEWQAARQSARAVSPAQRVMASGELATNQGEPAAGGAVPEVVATVARLESERAVLEQRMREMEQQLRDVVESLARPGRIESESGAVPVAAEGTEERSRVRGEGVELGPEERVGGREWRSDGRTTRAREGWPSRAPWSGMGDRQGGERERADAGMDVPVRLVAAEPGAWGWSPVLLALLVVAVLAAVGAGVFLARELVARHGASVRAGMSGGSAGSAPATEAPGAVSSLPKPAAGTPAGGIAGGKTQSEAEITRMLGGWAAAAAGNDPVGESRFYASRLDRYFLKRDVSRAYVLGDKQAYRERGNRIARFAVSGFRFEFPTATTAVVSLTKTWSVEGPDQSGILHTGRSRLWLARTPEGWKITGEQDLRGE